MKEKLHTFWPHIDVSNLQKNCIDISKTFSFLYLPAVSHLRLNKSHNVKELEPVWTTMGFWWPTVTLDNGLLVTHRRLTNSKWYEHVVFAYSKHELFDCTVYKYSKSCNCIQWVQTFKPLYIMQQSDVKIISFSYIGKKLHF